MLKLEIWTPSNWVSGMNHIGCSLAIATSTGNIFAINTNQKDQLGLNLARSLQETG